jgi:hypothetical protein
MGKLNSVLLSNKADLETLNDANRPNMEAEQRFNLISDGSEPG